MIVHFVWHGCTLDVRAGQWGIPPRRVFWVSVTPEERPSDCLLYEWEVAEDEMLAGRYLWFVPEDLVGVARGQRVYPVSGMWNGRTPWRAGPAPVTVSSFEELAGLDTSAWATLANHTSYPFQAG